MAEAGPARPTRRRPTPECPTGIAELDEIAGSDLPAQRSTLTCRGAACAKTLLALERW